MHFASSIGLLSLAGLGLARPVPQGPTLPGSADDLFDGTPLPDTIDDLSDLLDGVTGFVPLRDGDVGEIDTAVAARQPQPQPLGVNFGASHDGDLPGPIDGVIPDHVADALEDGVSGSASLGSDPGESDPHVSAVLDDLALGLTIPGRVTYPRKRSPAVRARHPFIGGILDKFFGRNGDQSNFPEVPPHVVRPGYAVIARQLPVAQPGDQPAQGGLSGLLAPVFGLVDGVVRELGFVADDRQDPGEVEARHPVVNARQDPAAPAGPRFPRRGLLDGVPQDLNGGSDLLELARLPGLSVPVADAPTVDARQEAVAPEAPSRQPLFGGILDSFFGRDDPPPAPDPIIVQSPPCVNLKVAQVGCPPP